MNPSNPDPYRPEAGSHSDADPETTKQKIEEDVRDVKHEMGAQVREKADAGKHRIATESDALSDAIDAAAAKLDEQDRDGLARYARDLSSKLANAAGQLEGRSVDELANDAKRLARNNPALFMLGSIAVGFGLSRFFKATAERDHQDDDADSRPDVFSNNGSAGTPLRRRTADVADAYATPTAVGTHQGREMP